VFTSSRRPHGGALGALAAAHPDDGHAQPPACVVEGPLEEPSPRAARDDAPSPRARAWAQQSGAARQASAARQAAVVDPVCRQARSAVAHAAELVRAAPPAGRRGARSARSGARGQGRGAQRGRGHRRVASSAAGCGGRGPHPHALTLTLTLTLTLALGSRPHQTRRRPSRRRCAPS